MTKPKVPNPPPPPPPSKPARITNTDLNKSYTHVNPRPTTNPPAPRPKK